MLGRKKNCPRNFCK